MANGLPGDAQQKCQKPRNIKTHNQRLVVGLLQQEKVLSVTEISERIKLSKTSVTRILIDLVKKRLVKTEGKGKSTFEGGKRPELFALNEEYGFFIIVHFGVSVLECALMDMKCGVLEKCGEEYDDKSDYPKCFSQMVRCVERLAEAARERGGAVRCVAVGCQGIVDSGTGTLCYTAHSRWSKDIALRDSLRAALSFETQIIVENVCRFAGYAELLFKPILAQELVVTVTAERTTGGCVLDHGVLSLGTNGFVGEVGHMVVEPHFPGKCICGGHGCFEMLVSPKALCEEARLGVAQYPDSALRPAIQADELTCPKIFAAADTGDPLARSLMDRSARYFSMLVQNIILLCDPSCIVIQGLYANAGTYFAERLRRMVVELPFFEIKQSLRILYSPIEYFSSVFLGGAFFAVNQILDNDNLYL
ncbi:MAG: ROK family transcriptional regulator [Clostridiales bacterium]|nr:ROK family transcriptional regulator [Clostridiales bacterium]